MPAPWGQWVPSPSRLSNKYAYFIIFFSIYHTPNFTNFAPMVKVKSQLLGSGAFLDRLFYFSLPELWLFFPFFKILINLSSIVNECKLNPAISNLFIEKKRITVRHQGIEFCSEHDTARITILLKFRK